MEEKRGASRKSHQLNVAMSCSIMGTNREPAHKSVFQPRYCKRGALHSMPNRITVQYNLAFVLTFSRATCIRTNIRRARFNNSCHCWCRWYCTPLQVKMKPTTVPNRKIEREENITKIDRYFTVSFGRGIRQATDGSQELKYSFRPDLQL